MKSFKTFLAVLGAVVIFTAFVYVLLSKLALSQPLPPTNQNFNEQMYFIRRPDGRVYRVTRYKDKPAKWELFYTSKNLSHE